MPDLWISCNTFFLLYESFFSKRKSLTLLLARGGRHVACQKSFGEFFLACYLSVFPTQTFFDHQNLEPTLIARFAWQVTSTKLGVYSAGFLKLLCHCKGRLFHRLQRWLPWEVLLSRTALIMSKNCSLVNLNFCRREGPDPILSYLDDPRFRNSNRLIAF